MTTAQQKMQAFESLKRLGELFPGLFEALQEWAQIGSIQAEGDKVVADTQAQMAAAKADFAQWKLSRDAERKQINDSIDTRRASADAEIAQVRAAAERARAKEGADHQRSIAMAQSQVGQAAERLEELKREHRKVLADIEDSQLKFGKSQSALDLVNREHAKVSTALADLKARLG